MQYHFEKTANVLTDLKAAKNEGLQEIDALKTKLEEGNIPGIRREYLKTQEQRLKQTDELYAKKIESIERAQLDFCNMCEEKSAKILESNRPQLVN